MLLLLLGDACILGGLVFPFLCLPLPEQLVLLHVAFLEVASFLYQFNFVLDFIEVVFMFVALGFLLFLFSFSCVSDGLWRADGLYHRHCCHLLAFSACAQLMQLPVRLPSEGLRRPINPQEQENQGTYQTTKADYRSNHKKGLQIRELRQKGGTEQRLAATRWDNRSRKD